MSESAELAANPAAELAAVVAFEEALLVDLGRVVWAAAGLHAAVRDALTAMPALDTGVSFSERTLSLALAELEQRARRLSRRSRYAVMTWCRSAARPAKNARDRVLHAVTATTPDGHPVLLTTDHPDPTRLTAADLREVTAQLVHATATLPRPPYTLPSQAPALQPAA